MPITASGIIPVSGSDVATIPSIAYSIPDFEGQAIMRIFANSTESEIGCYSAVVTNGASFSQPKAVGSVLGLFALVALIASFATALYGEAVPTMRLHYAHSLSVGVVFAVFQHIFFTGALSVNWPSCLVAFWSNFAWSGGMIYSQTMQNSINALVGYNVGNTSEVGAAPSDSTQDNLGGGYDISKIYRRAMVPSIPSMRDLTSEIYKRDYSVMLRRDVMQRHVERALQRRVAPPDAAEGYRWYGNPVPSGLPLPGNYSGFAGTLAEENIAVSNAFMTGFLWFLILLVLLVAAVVGFKWSLEGLAHFNAIKQNRLRFFRTHWVKYTTAVALRICYLAFFMLMFLTIFEFTYQSGGAVKGVAGVIFAIFIVGIPGVAAYACYYKKHFTGSDANVRSERKKLLGVIPWTGLKKLGPSAGDDAAQEHLPASESSHKPLWKRKRSVSSMPNSVADNIHDSDDYTMKFGWLAARFRRTRWWFFTAWIFYEFVRAVFYAGASGYPLAQVFGLLIIEFVAFAFVAWARPFEGRRLNILVVYCLGFSKVASVALSAAFDVQFNLQRITTTVVGIVIIVIQGVLTIITMIAILVGAISSYMSVSRNHEQFRPRKWHGLREKYFDHLDRVVNDLPREAAPAPAGQAREDEHPGELKEGFEMKSMRRLAKIEDEDEEFASEMRSQDPNASYASLDDRVGTPVNMSDAALAGRGSGVNTPIRGSRAPSIQSVSQTYLPFGARPHRPSWSTRDFGPAGAESNERPFAPIDMNKSVADDESVAAPATRKNRHSRAGSRSSQKPPNVVAPQASTDSLHIGGDVSTRDTIGNVPQPTTRPRAGTHGSVRGSRTSTPNLALGEANMEGMFDSQPGSQRGSKFPLTPAQEMDEWGSGLTPKQSREN